MVPDWYKKQLKALDHTFAKGKSVVHIQALNPGLQPYVADTKEIPFLVHCLNQAMDVALRLDTNKRLLPDVEKGKYLVRERNAQGEWEDQISVHHVDETWDYPELPLPPKSVLDRILKLKRNDEQLLIVNFMSPTLIGKAGQRGEFPVMLIALQISENQILGTHIASFPERFTDLPMFIIEAIKKLNAIPEACIFHDEEVAMSLESLLAALSIETMHIDANAPPLVELVASLMQMLNVGR